MCKNEKILDSALCVVIVFLISITFVSCKRNRYELVKDDRGRVVRLDKETGEIVIVQNEKMVPVKTPEQQETETAAARAREEALSAPKQWSDQEFKQIGITKASLTTRWVDGTLWYKFEMQPIPKGINENYLPSQAPFTLTFNDKSGFELIKINLYQFSFSTYVDEDRKPIALAANSSVLCTRGVYEELAGWGLTWRF